MHPSLRETDHRPWQLPSGPWVWRQSWQNLLFAHWRVDPNAIRPLIPRALELDLWDGMAWIGVVPFHMVDVSIRGLPALPGMGLFPELNVRTYVSARGKPGVWFFSLDTPNRLAILGGRKIFTLPYYRSRLRLNRLPTKAALGGASPVTSEPVSHNCSATRGDGTARFEMTYRSAGPVQRAKPGSLEEFLTKRYCLYAASRSGVVRRTEVHHAPWPLQSAEVDIGVCEPGNGLTLKGSPEIAHFSQRVDVVAWNPNTL